MLINHLRPLPKQCIATAAGLGVGILALIVHRYLSAKADRLIAELELFGLQVVDWVKGDGV